MITGKPLIFMDNEVWLVDPMASPTRLVAQAELWASVMNVKNGYMVFSPFPIFGGCDAR